MERTRAALIRARANAFSEGNPQGAGPASLNPGLDGHSFLVILHCRKRAQENGMGEGEDGTKGWEKEKKWDEQAKSLRESKRTGVSSGDFRSAQSSSE